MPVNGDTGHPVRRSQAERRATTRAALLQAARELFGAKGFAATGREEIVERAGVTRGALYHHFAGKEGLFRAVFELVEQDTIDDVARAAMLAPNPKQMLFLGCRAFLDATTDPAFQRIVLLDAPAVLGWDEWRRVDARYGLGLISHALEAAMDTHQIDRQPVEPLAHLLLAALNEAALYIAGSDDAGSARATVGDTIERLLDRL
jgi:AcrR family transcriptional regulator